MTAAGASACTIALIYGRGGFELARDGEAELPRLAFLEPLEEMPAAQRDIAVVAADFGLRARRDRMTLGIDAEVHGGLAAAFANRLELDQRVGQRQQGGRTWEEVAKEIGPEAIARPTPGVPSACVS